MTSLEPKPADSEATFNGKRVGDLQDGVKIDGTTVTGNLKYVQQFTGFSRIPVEQEGNYLVLDFSGVDDSVKIEHHSSSGNRVVDVKRDADGRVLILRVQESTKSKIGKFTFTQGAVSVDKTFDMSGLVLAAKAG